LRVAHGAERARDDDARHARLARRREQVTRAHDVAVVYLALASRDRRELGRAVVDLRYAADRSPHGVHVAEVTLHTLDRDPGEAAVAAALALQRDDRLAALDEAAEQVGAEVSAPSCDEYGHALVTPSTMLLEPRGSSYRVLVDRGDAPLDPPVRRAEDTRQR